MTLQLEFALGAPPDVGDMSEPALVAFSRELLSQLGCSGMAASVRVVWSSRLRSTAGTATTSLALVRLNSALLQFGAGEVETTLKHELAHLVAHERSGRRRIAPHGPEWQQACRELGLLNEPRCHRLPLPRRQLQRKLAYRCPSCGLVLQRVRALRRRSACLACCRRHNHGRYDERFRLVPAPPPAR